MYCPGIHVRYPVNLNKTENQSEICGLLKLEAVEVNIETILGLSGPENYQAPILEAVGAI